MFNNVILRQILLINPTPQSAAAAKKIGKDISVLSHKKLAPDTTKKHFLLNRDLKPEDLHGIKIDFKKYTHIIMAHDSKGRSVLPRLAAILGKSMISDITKIEGSKDFTRLMFAGNVVSQVKTNEDQILFSIRPTAFTGESLKESSGEIEEIKLSEPRVKTTNVQTSGGDRPELGGAKVVVSGGRALKSAENFKTYLSLT
eukprot:NODE_73_length_24441_cov_0.672952.p12 type:complete len:200 gc:universal NODE_73_length_24441_cov_0.672952:15417-14818(-)